MFDLHENKPVGETHFNMNGFARGLNVTQRQKATRKWPIDSYCLFNKGHMFKENMAICMGY